VGAASIWCKFASLFHLFSSQQRNFIEKFYRVGRDIVDDLWTTRYSVMKAIDFAYPKFEEQQAIADYLDFKTAHIDRIVETINTQIDKLKELRKTLINDVVTGKIKVYQGEGTD
jgi:type I restriction enzyme S subunit